MRQLPHVNCLYFGSSRYDIFRAALRGISTYTFQNASAAVQLRFAQNALFLCLCLTNEDYEPLLTRGIQGWFPRIPNKEYWHTLSMKPVFFGTTSIQLEIQTSLLLTRLLQISANEIPSPLRNNSEPYGELSPSQNLGLCGEAFGLSTNNPKSFRTVELSRLCNDLPRSALFCDRGKIDTRYIQGWGFYLAKYLPITAFMDGFVSRSNKS